MEKPLGVIDALYGGFALVFSRPWVLLIPIAVDLFLWMGPRVTAVPIFQQIITWVGTSQPSNASPEMLQAFDAAKSAWLAAGNKFNVISVTALVAIGMPTLMGLEVPSASFLQAPSTGLAIVDNTTFAGIVALMVVMGILVGCLYLQTLAGGVHREENSAGTFATRTFKSYVSVGALIIAGCIIGFLIMLPFLLSAALVGIFDQNIASFLFLLGLMLLMWAALYLSFAVPAIFVSGANLWQAIVSSVTVFRYNFWSALGLVCLIYLIDVGFQIIWQSFEATAWGALGADVANAFLGSSLIAAMMLFYHDRITWLNRIREQIR